MPCTAPDLSDNHPHCNPHPANASLAAHHAWLLGDAIELFLANSPSVPGTSSGAASIKSYRMRLARQLASVTGAMWLSARPLADGGRVHGGRGVNYRRAAFCLL